MEGRGKERKEKRKKEREGRKMNLDVY